MKLGQVRIAYRTLMGEELEISNLKVLQAD
jgi:hypothetical protein